MTKKEKTVQTLEAARLSKDPDAIAAALVNHSDELVKSGRLGDARRALDEAAVLHRVQGRRYDEAQCIQFTATLCRLEGRLEEASDRAKRAADLAGHGNPIAVSAATELAEIALARGDAPAAAAAFGNALVEGERAGLLPAARAVLLRRRAIALANAGQFVEAANDSALACELLLETGNPAEATRAKIEEATAWQSAREKVAAEGAHDEARRMAEAAGDHPAMADLHLLNATKEIIGGNLPAALAAGEAAREEALAGRAPISYISAACAISEIADRMGNRLAAYEALVVGWVTLSDLLGKDAGKEAFSPKLQALVERWGEADFRKIKSRYEEQRRAISGA